MKIFDRTTGLEIFPKTKSRSAGTDRVIECFLKTRGEDITNIIFGATSRGCINGKDLPKTQYLMDVNSTTLSLTKCLIVHLLIAHLRNVYSQV